MNDETLYRLTVTPRNPGLSDTESSAFEVINNGVLMPVEPCMHGNYARHLLTILENFERVYCEGDR
jgi:hypothetical protein